MKILMIVSIAFLVLMVSCTKTDYSQAVSLKARIELESCSQIHYKTIQDSLFVFVLNIFTPNGDGINDVLLVGTNAIIENMWFLLLAPDGRILLESQTPNELIFMENIPDSSAICTFFLTGNVNGDNIWMSGKISLILHNPLIETYQIFLCHQCLFASAFDFNNLIVNPLMNFNEFCP